MCGACARRSRRIRRIRSGCRRCGASDIRGRPRPRRDRDGSDMKWADQLDIIRAAAVAAMAVGLVGLVVSWLLRRRSLRWHLAILTIVAVTAPYLGLIVITQQMFLSSHDLTVATYVGSAAALVTLVVALGLGAAIGRWSGVVRSNVVRLGTGVELVDA